MAQTVPYKIYSYSVNGQPYVDILPGFNTPYGASETDFSGLLNIAKNKTLTALSYFGNDRVNQDWARSVYGDPNVLYQRYTALNSVNPANLTDADIGNITTALGINTNPDILRALATGQTTTAGYINDQGNFQTTNPDIQAADMARHEALVAQGLEKKVPVGSGFGYIPTGSAGDLLLSDPQKYYQQYPDQVPSQPGVSQTSPQSSLTFDEIRNGQTQNPPQYDAQGMLISGGTSTPTTSSTTSNTNSNPVSNPVSTPSTGNSEYDVLLQQMNDFLTKLTANGQQINPNITLDPTKLAEFTKTAASQIHPYYATQLQAATDTFLGNLGYDVNKLKLQTEQAEQAYGRNLETIGSESADQGFAQSGIRQKRELQLAQDTQNSLDEARSNLQQSALSSARQFAQTYGGQPALSLNAPTLGQAPRVLPGQSKFDFSGGNTGLYTLNPEIYGKLVGSEQNAEKSATDTLASQLASNYQIQQANNQARTLNLI